MDLGDILGVRFGFPLHWVPWIIIYITTLVIQWLASIWRSWDELFIIITHFYTFIPTCFFIFFYTHSSFVLSLFVLFYPRWSSSRFMKDVFLGAHHLSLDVVHSNVGLSHLNHMVLRYLTLRTQRLGIIYWVFGPLFTVVSFTFYP